MKNCIFCSSLLDDHTRSEHILLNALGGRMTSKNVLCSNCNNKFGSGADKDLADSVAPLRTICGLKSGTNQDAPSIRGIDVGEHKFDLHGDGSVTGKTVHRALDIVISGNEAKVNIKANSPEQYEVLLEAAVKKISKDLDLDKETVRQRLTNDQNITKKEYIVPAPLIMEQVQFGSNNSKQSMAKALLCLWASYVGNNECCSDRYDLIRDYVNQDVEYNEICDISFEKMPDSITGFGSNPNFVWVGANAYGCVYGYFRLFGAIGWKFKMGTTIEYKSKSAFLISDPFDTSNWKYLENDDKYVCLEWVVQAGSDKAKFDSVKAYLSSMMGYAVNRNKANMVSIWVDDAYAYLAFDHDRTLNEDDILLLSDYVAKRAAAYHLNQPIEI